MCMYFVGCRLMKNKPLTESLEICSLMFFLLLEHKQSQMKTAATVAPNKRLHMHARFYFFAHLFAFVCKKIQDSDNQKFKVLRTETFSHVISNPKSARTKFKLIGKFKMLRKLKQQKAFPARSLSFCCTFIRFCTQRNKKSNYKKFKDFRQNTSI